MVLLQPQEDVVIHANHSFFWKAEWFMPWSIPQDSSTTEEKTAQGTWVYYLLLLQSSGKATQKKLTWKPEPVI